MGNTPVIIGTWTQANFSEMFESTDDKAKENVAVLACGPKGLVNTVKNECNSESPKA